jgi:hypothetical protein
MCGTWQRLLKRPSKPVTITKYAWLVCCLWKHNLAPTWGGRGLIIPPYHRGSLPSVQHIGIVMFIPQELVGEELALEQDSLHRGVQNWDATPTFRQHLSKSLRKWLVRGEKSSGGRGRWSGDSTVRGSLRVVPRVPAASEARRPRGGRSETSGAGTRDWSPVSGFHCDATSVLCGWFERKASSIHSFTGAYSPGWTFSLPFGVSWSHTHTDTR